MGGRAPSVLLAVLCLSALMAAGGVLLIVRDGPASPQPAQTAGCGRVCGRWDPGCVRLHQSVKDEAHGSPSRLLGLRVAAAAGRAAAGRAAAGRAAHAPSGPPSDGRAVAPVRTGRARHMRQGRARGGRRVHCFLSPCGSQRAPVLWTHVRLHLGNRKLCTFLRVHAHPSRARCPDADAPQQGACAQQRQPAGKATPASGARASLDDGMHGAVASTLLQLSGCMDCAGLAVAHELLRLTFAAATPPSPPPPPPPLLWR